MIGEEQSIERAGVRIVYQRLGNRAFACGLTMLHGLASNATRWHELMTHSALRAQCELLAIDQRGHGRSSTFRPYTRADWCADVAAILAQEKLQSILVGHSLGAQVALDYAVDYKTSVRGLVLIDPVFPQALSGAIKTVARWRRLLPPLIHLLRFFSRLGLHKRHYVYRDLHQLDIETRAYLAAHPHEQISTLYMDPFADLKFIPLVNYCQDLYEVTRPLADLARVEVPVLVLLSKGASTSDVAHNQEILKAIARCEIQVIDADHWLLTEKPVEARQAIDAWCQRLLGHSAAGELTQ